MFKIIVVLLTFLSGDLVNAAGIKGLAGKYVARLQQARARITNQQLLVGASNTCNSQQLVNMTADNKLTITLAFGYMDVSHLDDQYVDSGMGDMPYTLGDALDLDARAAMASVLTSDCPKGKDKKTGKTKKFFACEFTAKGNGQYKKSITNQFTGKKMEVTVTLVSPSLSSKVNYSKQQLNNSQAVENYFHGALQSQDAVIYMGHARSGGGPDFFPPVYSSGYHVNYGYYQSTKEGISGMVGALHAAARPSSVIGVLACRSTGLFKNAIDSVAPHSVLITAGNLFDNNDVIPTGYALVEGLMAQKCGDTFRALAKIQPNSSGFVNVSF